MAHVGALSFPVLVPILFTCFSFFLSAASSSQPPAAPLHNASDADFQALLCLKLHLSPGNAGAMASWRNDSMQYCSWPGITCSKRHAHRVVALALESLDLHGQIPPCIGNLTFLTSIHLPNNQLVGEIPPELGHLTRLSYMNLSFNNLTGEIPSTLSSCTRLQIIDLGSNSLDGEIPLSLSKCSNLEQIYLDNNKLFGVIPEGLGTLSNLEILFLASNNLTGNIPFSLGSSPSLMAVILTNNTLTGGIPPLLANSSSLEWLDLTNTHLSGEIPPTLFNSPSLRFMDLGANNFVGSIPPISNIFSPLEYIILSQNNLSGIIPSSLGNLSSLLFLYLSENNFQGTIPSSLSIIPNFQRLDMSYNNFSGTVPSSLFKMSTLTYLNVGKNNLIGEIPYNIGYKLPNIEELILEGNRFQGQVPTSLANARNLQVINLRDNAFDGIIPSFGYLPNLVELNLGKNRLEAGNWSFLSSLTNCSQLVRLRLDMNILKGVLPKSIAYLSKRLEILLLSSNEISGTIPQEIGRLTNLVVLQMEQNLLSGNLPESLVHLPNLYVLSLSRNKLSGQIPLSIGNLSQLSELYLDENNFSGPIPAALGHCNGLEKLNLSCNSFVGSIPKELFTLSSLSEGLDLSHNQLSGQIPLEIGGLINVGPLNISNNQLSGQIPTTLGECVHLESLHMEGNHLDGRIPETFYALRGIIEMDLSRNNLSGEIPRFFESFNSMKLFNLSFNNLEGTVPTGGIFQNASEVFIQGNEKLCSNNPLLHVTLCNVDKSKQRHTSNIMKIVGFSALGFIPLLFVAIIILKKRKKAKKETHQSCKEFKRFSYTDLVKATNGFSLLNLVGSGKYGSVYKGKFEIYEHVVAIKVFKLDQLGAPKSFLAECEALRSTRHRNLVRVITACSTYNPAGHEFKALILEYMPNGSLESWLYPKHLKTPLSLGSRIKTATDIASALDYLHNHCSPPIVHCDLKPSNILLDDVMDAHVGDFGLAKFLRNYSSSSNNSSTSLLGPRGSIGYIAPEYGFGSKVSVEGDVYSYGIIILEMLTGKRPTDEMFNNGLDLHKFVGSAFAQNIMDVLDPIIVPSYEGENHAVVGILSCIRRLVKLGLSCSMETSKDRPTMQDAYAEVTAVKEAFSTLQC